MIGEDAFCPKTGAPLTEEQQYDDAGRPRRVVTADEESLAADAAGELTTGAVRSSKAALFNRFRRCHERHHETDDALYRKAALALARLKRTAEDTESWDVHVWYALRKRLAAAGHDVEWMHAHVEPRCPHCHSRLRYEAYADTVTARCVAGCGGRPDQLTAIRETIAALYTRAFDTSIDPDEFVQF
ncbi:hypothetical protein [Halococcus agarilyticus]|uniref:hypothetical protein n=1 Tax=Halococcus agarilyticus TaxID=1232219 RepID=UPI0006779BDD|nr:hypothetical protein [Halococcus agarilyticus]